MAIRLYLDEDVWTGLALHLRRAGFDVTTTAEAGRVSQQFEDHDQLEFAVRGQRAILSHNHRDFVPLDLKWKAEGREHFGIILSPRRSPSELCRPVESHLRRSTAEAHYNLLSWC
jgi:hypothetical protein